MMLDNQMDIKTSFYYMGLTAVLINPDRSAHIS